MTLDDGHYIVTSFWKKPIPQRCFDWAATLDDYEPGGPVGHGETELSAIRDLLERLND